MKTVAEILSSIRSRRLSISKGEKLLRLDTLEVLGELARIDTSRFMRRGVPEIIYAGVKTDEQISKIVSGLVRGAGGNRTNDLPIILSKIRDRNQASTIRRAVRELHGKSGKFEVKYHENAGIITIEKRNHYGNSSGSNKYGRVALLCAGTSDIKILNETETILEILHCKTLRFNDVGVAALHRLKDPLRKIVMFDPDVIVVAAGMEGALPSLIASLSSVPVIGLPTSNGYGFGRGGEAALMNMLQACPLGLSVVNIDAGVAAGVIAYLIAKRSHCR